MDTTNPNVTITNVPLAGATTPTILTLDETINQLDGYSKQIETSLVGSEQSKDEATPASNTLIYLRDRVNNINDRLIRIINILKVLK